MSEYQHVTKTHTESKGDWLLKIDNNYLNLNYLRDEEVWRKKIIEHEVPKNITAYLYNNLSYTERSLYAAIEADTERSFMYIQRESIKNRPLFARMALFLSGEAIEQICTKIFSKDNVNEEFVELFYDCFFTFFLTRKYTWYSLHLLIRASRAYPTYFRNTLKHLLKDRYIKSTILEDYMQYITAKECTDIMKLVMDTNLTMDDFNRAASVIYILYKKCEKTDSLFRYMLAKLELCSRTSAYNKNFGKLMWYFIQNISGREIMFKDLKQMVKRHCTPYKNLCLHALDEYVNELIALQDNFVDEGRQIIIPRPLDHFQI